MKTKSIFILVYFIIASPLLFAQTNEVEELIIQGIQQHDNGEYEKAIKTYKKALKIDPNSSLANYELSLTYYVTKDYKNAEKFSKKSIELSDENAVAAYVNYGNSVDMQGNHKKALQIYEKAIESFDNYLLYFNYAVTCFNGGDYDKAENAVIKAITNSPTHASSHFLLAQVMEHKDSRIKVMLPIYFFLLLEPDSNRSEIMYAKLQKYWNYGIAKGEGNSTNVTVSIGNLEDEFSTTEMLISIIKAANSAEEFKGKSSLELFAINTQTFFKSLSEQKGEHSNFWWDFYVSYFSDLDNNNYTEPFCYYISASQGEEPNEWMENHHELMQNFFDWATE